MATGSPNIDGVKNTAVLTGGVFGSTVGSSPTDAAGFHGASVVQSTGYGTVVGAVKTANFDATTANANVVASMVASLVSDLVAKGVIAK